MTDKSFIKPSVVQDFEVRINPQDIKDGQLSDEAAGWLEQVVRNFIHRFEPQVSPGKGFSIHIRMETER